MIPDSIYIPDLVTLLLLFTGNRAHVIFAGYLALADGIYSITILASLAFYWSDDTGVAATLIGNFRQVPYRMNTSIILMISSHRLWSLLAPFRSQINGLKTHIIIGLTAMFMMIFTGVTSQLKPVSPCFTFLNCSRDPNRLVCGKDISTSDNKTNLLDPDSSHFEMHEISKLLVAPITGVLAFSAIIIINIMLWQVSVNSSRRLIAMQGNEERQRFKGVITTVAVAGLYIVALTPACLNNASKILCMVRSNPSVYTGVESFYFATDLVEEWLYTVSTVGNPLLYAYINTTYRRFMKAQIMKVWWMATCADPGTRVSATSFSRPVNVSIRQRVKKINSSNQLTCTVPQNNLDNSNDVHNETEFIEDHVHNETTT